MCQGTNVLIWGLFQIVHIEVPIEVPSAGPAVPTHVTSYSRSSRLTQRAEGDIRRRNLSRKLAEGGGTYPNPNPGLLLR